MFRSTKDRMAEAFAPSPVLDLPGYERPTETDRRDETALIAALAPPAELQRAEQMADRSGVSVLDVLLTCTDGNADELTARLAAYLGIPRLQRDEIAGARLSVADARHAMASGLLRLPNGTFVVSLRGSGVIELARRIRENPGLRPHMRLAGPDLFTEAIVHASRSALTAAIANGPAPLDPSFSAGGPTISRVAAGLAFFVIATSIFATVFAPLSANIAFGLLFMALTVLRLLAIRRELAERPAPRIPDEDLPIYTVLVPLYREPESVPALIDTLSRLDYPKPKLDIKFLVEEDDAGTARALDASTLPQYFSIVTVPGGAPRTKPRALNAGLVLARGALLTVFDAEDRPEPGQLRAAVQAFRDGPDSLACVQARLVIDNAPDGWLTRIFALEYAGLFDALLPALSRSRLLFPLGGTSNHFRTPVLERIGGWDAWNVTEDADLGLRLARLGYRAAVIPSSTYEEAPNRLGAWLKQRTRWLKGYLVTWTVHMRNPVRLYRELGLLDFLAFHAFIGGVPVSALILPVFLCGVGKDIVTGVWLTPAGAWHHIPPYTVHAFNLVLGFGTAMVLAAIGADRRGLKGVTAWIWTVPVYWLLSSLAAWRAAWQLLRDPFKWEKTQHGLARTSMSGQRLTDAS